MLVLIKARSRESGKAASQESWQVIACYESERARGDQLQAEKVSLQSDLRKTATPIERRPSVPQLLVPPDASAMEGSVKSALPAPWSWQPDFCNVF